MKKLLLVAVCAVLSLVGLATLTHRSLMRTLQNYVYHQTEQKFGDQSVAPQYEQKIRAIGDRVGIQEPFIVRRMNAQSMQVFGYHNAFALQPLLYNYIPVGLQARLFISEGFFEDLSEHEQEFLIGHELIHIKHAHVRYYNLLSLFSLLPIVLLLWLMRRKIRSLCAQRSWLYISVCIGLLLVSDSAIDLIGLAYKRSMERQADQESITLLKSYDGGIAFLQRLQREFKMPLHNNWYGLFADHPSCHERFSYFAQLQQQHQGTTYEYA